MARLIAHRSGRWALAAIVLLILAAIIGPMLVSHSSIELGDIVGMRNQPPSWSHLLGTDQYGRDLLARVLSGGRISLMIGMLSVLLSITVGIAYGLVSGYAGGAVDATMMRVLDGLLSIPRVLLLLAVLTVLERVELPGLILLLGATGWFGISRFVRAETLTAKRLGYVDSARALGVSDSRIVWRHILPNVLTPVIVTATLAVGNVIVLEAGLSYLGVGAREPTPTWGSIFYDGMAFFAGNWWMVLFPGIAIAGTALAFNVLGDALRDILDPNN